MANLPENARALYRIMADKSRLGFGKYSDMTVRDVIKIDPPYLAWAYYCLANVSLKPEILEELGLEPIAKPGTDEARLKAWKRKRSEGYTEEERLHGYYKIYRKQRSKAIGGYLRVRNATSFSKAQLQAINHGHMKKD